LKDKDLRRIHEISNVINILIFLAHFSFPINNLRIAKNQTYCFKSEKKISAYDKNLRRCFKYIDSIGKFAKMLESIVLQRLEQILSKRGR